MGEEPCSLGMFSPSADGFEKHNICICQAGTILAKLLSVLVWNCQANDQIDVKKRNTEIKFA
jgi:hypothetical protein